MVIFRSDQVDRRHGWPTPASVDRTPLSQLQPWLMSPPNQPTAFSALGIVERLSQEELEHLTEFSDQLESLRFLSRNLPGPSPTIEQAIEIVQAAPAALRKKRRKRKLTKAEKAWLAELRSELPDKEAREGDRLPAVLSWPEIHELLGAAKSDSRDYLLLRVFYATAMRISEVADILVADLYLSEFKIFVREGKGDKDRYVLIDPETAQLLAEFTKGLGPEQKVFEIGERQMSRIIQEYADQVGITERYETIRRNFSPHSFRHTCATHLYENGMDIYVLSNLLGHSSISVTKGYVHTGIARQLGAYQAAHPLCLPLAESPLSEES